MTHEAYSVRMTLRPMTPEPQRIRPVPLGGDQPIIVITTEVDDNNYITEVDIDSTGLREPSAVADYLIELGNHILTTAYDILDPDGITHVTPDPTPEAT